ncbi:oxidoreductase [Xylaria arbuscula]|nr:oxidoreductase [Xylaria arbuscula]
MSEHQQPTPKRTDSAIALQEEEQLTTTPPAKTRSSSAQMLLSEAILTRHSSRLYLPQPVPQEILTHALTLAAHAPSNTNTQAWRLFVVTGSALSRLKTSLVAAATTTEPNLPPLPASFDEYRSALGRQVFGVGWGIPHDDHEARRAAVLRNYDFFGAPAAVIVCMSAELEGVEAFSVGMYLQTFLLALTEAGVGSCVEISVAGYSDVVKKEVGIPEDLVVLCGVAVGFEDGMAGVNRIRAGRDEVAQTTVWVQ